MKEITNTNEIEYDMHTQIIKIRVKFMVPYMVPYSLPYGWFAEWLVSVNTIWRKPAIVTNQPYDKPRLLLPQLGSIDRVWVLLLPTRYEKELRTWYEQHSSTIVGSVSKSMQSRTAQWLSGTIHICHLVRHVHLAFRILEKWFWGQNGHTKDGPQSPGRSYPKLDI